MVAAAWLAAPVKGVTLDVVTAPVPVPVADATPLVTRTVVDGVAEMKVPTDDVETVDATTVEAGTTEDEDETTTTVEDTTSVEDSTVVDAAADEDDGAGAEVDGAAAEDEESWEQISPVTWRVLAASDEEQLSKTQGVAALVMADSFEASH